MVRWPEALAAKKQAAALNDILRGINLGIC
jgi:hypothetical protein